MSDNENINHEENETSSVPDELTLLKERADMMGITYHPSIGVDKLKLKIEEHKAKTAIPENASIEDLDALANNINIEQDSQNTPVRETEGQRRVRLRKEATKLVRVRVSCMNPHKTALKGEIFSVGNSAVGMVKKFIPFNAEQGWHVPQIILTALQNRKYMAHYEEKIGNKKVKRHKLIPEFSIEILDPLSPEELKELAQRQLMASGAAS